MDKPEMTRPAICVGFTAFGTLLLCTFFGTPVTLYLSAVCLLLGLILLLARCHRKAPVLLLMLFTAAIFSGYYTLCCNHFVTPYAQYAGEKHTIRAEILSEPEESTGNFYYKAQITQLSDINTETDFTVRLSHGESLQADIGDTVICTVKFFDYTDTFGLSSKTARLSSGAVLGAYIADYTNISVERTEKRNLLYYCTKIRRHMDAKIRNALPQKEAAVLSAMLLGLRDEIPDDINRDYKGAGATHILVISGMHMAIVSQFMLRILQRLGMRRRIASAITIPLILAFMAVSGFSASVLRSGITQIIFLFGLAIGRKSDELNSLALSALFILLFRPFWIGSISFLLSFTSTLGIITLQPRILQKLISKINNEKTRRVTVQLLSPVVCSVAAILGSLPVQLYVFGTVNFVSVISSVLILGASAWIIRFGLPTVLLLCIPALSAAASPLLLITGLLIRYQNFVTVFLSDRFTGSTYIPGRYVQGTVLIVVLFLLLVFGIRNCKPLPISTFLLAALLFFTGTVADTLFSLDQTKLVLYQNTYAACTAVLRGERAIVLHCSGSETAISDVLRTNGANTIELLCVGEKESDIRCAEGLLKTFSTERMLIPDSVYLPTNIKAETYRYATNITLADHFAVGISSSGRFLDFTVNGKRIICDKNGAAYKEKHCDIAVVDSLDSRVRGALTILCSDKDPAASSALTDGDYLLLNEHEAVCLYFSPDGSYSIQRG